MAGGRAGTQPTEVIEMSFVQVIEYDTDRPDEVRALSEEWGQHQLSNAPARMTVAEDRERPGHFVMVAEFDSYDQAMAHSAQPETGAYADRMRRLAKNEPRFVNLEVAHQET
jgi:quinol monooxygenase YgiN